MTATVALAPPAPTRLALRIADALVVGVFLLATWLKLAFPVGVDLALDDILMLAATGWIVGERAARRDGRLPRCAAVLLGLFLLMFGVYLAGYGAVATNLGLTQWLKGMAAWTIHATFAVAAVAHLAERGGALWRRCLRAFVIGFAINATYAAVQLAFGFAGVNTDKILIAPIFGGAPTGGATLTGAISSVNAFGAQQITSVLRPTGLTVDPNHLGVMLAMPIMILTALFLDGRAPAIRRHRALVGVLVALGLLAQALTQSRSGVLADLVGLGLLVLVYRSALRTRAVLVPLGVLAVVAGAAMYVERDYISRVIESRTQTSSSGSQIHTQLYSEIPKALRSDPLTGVGLNQFPIRFSFETDRDKLFGPHSFIVATLTETGLAGGLVALATLVWLVLQAVRLRQRARRRPTPGDDRPALAWGLLAALLATFAGNVFYLTMVHNSWWCLLVLVAAAPDALAPLPAREAVRAPAAAPLPAGA